MVSEGQGCLLASTCPQTGNTHTANKETNKRGIEPRDSSKAPTQVSLQAYSNTPSLHFKFNHLCKQKSTGADGIGQHQNVSSASTTSPGF